MQRSFKVISFVCNESIKDILIAELSLIGYDSFLVNDNGFEASILVEDYCQSSIDAVIETFQISDSTHYYVNEIQERNWNKEWEKNYDPIIVDDYCMIKATFHDIKKQYPIDLIINPKMSFGTGHHDTTHLMVQHQLSIDHKNKSVLDAGCGTGILSILAEKLGAEKVVGFDIDQWAYENSKENILLNKCNKIKILDGSINNIPANSSFDIILANINLNIILEEMKSYSDFLKQEGSMIISGFFTDDYDIINECATHYGLLLQQKKIRNKWLSLVYNKRSN